VWTWDITYLRDARYKGKFFYAYAIVDVFSRLAVHAKVYDADNAEYARTFLNEAFHKHGIRPRSLVVHSDNGASMKANETKALLEEWGIIHVSATTILTRSRSSDR
jgi:putative transposase